MLSADFETGVRNLGRKLNIPECEDHLKILEASAKLIHEKLRSDAPKTDAPVGKAFNVKGGDKCAFDDSNMDEAAKILRLLQIQVNTLAYYFRL